MSSMDSSPCLACPHICLSHPQPSPLFRSRCTSTTSELMLQCSQRYHWVTWVTQEAVGVYLPHHSCYSVQSTRSPGNLLLRGGSFSALHLLNLFDVGFIDVHYHFLLKWGKDCLFCQILNILERVFPLLFFFYLPEGFFCQYYFSQFLNS